MHYAIIAIMDDNVIFVSDDVVIINNNRDTAVGNFVAVDDNGACIVSHPYFIGILIIEMYCQIKCGKHLCDEPPENVNLPETI